MRTTPFTLTLFIITLTILCLIGLIFVYSSSCVFALEKCGSATYFFFKHLNGLLLGLGAATFLFLLPLKIIKKCTPLFFWGALTLTALTLVPGIGVTIHGSHRWLSLGFMIIQPSELLKIAFILYVAFVLSKKEYYLTSFLYGYLPFLCILSAVALILLKQPDFGLSVTLTLTAFMLFFIAQFQSQHLLFTALPLVPAAALLIYLKPYRFKRIVTFLNPWDDPQGAGFQIIQSLIAIGSGHWWGVGIAHSKQKFFYLPMQHTDFIFSIFAEETGFIGSSFLILLYCCLLYAGIKLAWYLEDTFSVFTVLGFTLLTTLQALINIGVATAILPTKGIGLPFVSYGNSALIASLCLVGICLNCIYEEQS